MIKFGNRKNLLYPSMLVLFIGLLKIINTLIDDFFTIGDFTLLIVWFISKSFFGIVSTIYNHFTTKIKSSQVEILTPIQSLKLPKKINKLDNNFKIIILIFLASFFDFFVSLIRTFYIDGDKLSKSIKNRFRCCQIFVAGLLCYFTIRTKLQRHHIFSLIAIFISLTTIIITEIIYKNLGYLDNSYSALILTIASNIGRAFMDTIEKYLFEFNYLHPFKVLMLEGIMNTILIVAFYFIVGCPDQFKDFDTNKPIDSYKWLNILIFVLLIILYFIFSGFRNIYRVMTIKLYSPMTRSITEAIFDPFLIGYKLLDYIRWPFYWVNMICLIIMVFFSLVFNEFIIIYCCGLEYDTHLEIIKRANNRDTINDGSVNELEEDNKEDLNNI